jgi:hypothetical protein
MPIRKSFSFYQLRDRQAAPLPEKSRVLGRNYSLLWQGTQSLRDALQTAPPPRELRDDTERPRDFGQNVRRAQELFALVRGADDRTQPRFALRNGRVANGRGKHTGFK